MVYLFHLSGEDEKLAVSEVLALIPDAKIIRHKGRILQLETNKNEKEVKKASSRTSLLKHSAVKTAELKDFTLESMDSVSWSWVRSPFAVRVEDLTGRLDSGMEKRLAGLIWNTLKNPEVDLENPKTTVFFVAEDKKIHLCKLLWKREKARFVLREPNKKPAFHPTSLVPKLARLLVNLARAQEGKFVLDPFCGVGSVLIEAAVIGCKVTGTDIDSRMIDKAKTNLEFYKKLYEYKNYKVEKLNALELSKKFRKNSIDAIATDPPYGRSSHVGAKSVRDLYKGFLSEAHKVLKKGRYLAMLYAHYSKIENLVDKKRWLIANTGGIYVHGGLTRKILVLQKK